MDPEAALREGNYASLCAWFRKGGFEPDWSKYPEETKDFTEYCRRNSQLTTVTMRLIWEDAHREQK